MTKQDEHVLGKEDNFTITTDGKNYHLYDQGTKISTASEYEEIIVNFVEQVKSENGEKRS